MVKKKVLSFECLLCRAYDMFGREGLKCKDCCVYQEHLKEDEQYYD